MILLTVALGYIGWCIFLALACGVLSKLSGPDYSGDGGLAWLAIWLVGTGIAPAIWLWQALTAKRA